MIHANKSGGTADLSSNSRAGEHGVIRQIGMDDVEDVVGLVVAAGMFTTDESQVVRELLHDYDAGAGTNGHTCLIDEESGQVVAVAYYQPKGPADRLWDLTMIAVIPQLQGTGRGTALLRRVEDDLRSRDQRILLVDTSGTAQYDRTRTFYERCGYTQVARIPDYWTDSDDLVVFAKRLT